MKNIFISITALALFTILAPQAQAQGSIVPAPNQPPQEAQSQETQPQEAQLQEAQLQEAQPQETQPQVQSVPSAQGQLAAKAAQIKQTWLEKEKDDLSLDEMVTKASQQEPYKMFLKYMPKPPLNSYPLLSDYYWKPIKSLLFSAASSIMWIVALDPSLYSLTGGASWLHLSIPSALALSVPACWYNLRSMFSLAMWSGHSVKTALQNSKILSRHAKNFFQLTKDYNYIKKQQTLGRPLKERKMRSLNKHKYAHGYTLLHMAVALGDSKMVDWMLAEGHTLDDRDRHGHTPLDIAAHTAYSYAYKKMLQINGFELEITSDEEAPNKEAPNKEALNKETKEGEQQTQSLHHLAILNNQLQGINGFLRSAHDKEKFNQKHGIEQISAAEKRLAHLSKREGKKRLQKWQATMSKAALLIIKQEHHEPEFFKSSRPRKSTDQAHKNTPQTYLALAHFLDSGMPADVADADGNTLLHIAVMAGNWQAASLLLQRHAPLHIKNKQGLSPAQITHSKVNSFNDMYNYIVQHVDKAADQYPEVQQMAQSIAKISELRPLPQPHMTEKKAVVMADKNMQNVAKLMQNQEGPCQALLQVDSDGRVHAEIELGREDKQ